MKFIKRASLILLGRLLLFTIMSLFFWIPMIRYYIVRYRLWGGDWWTQIPWGQLDWLLIGVFFFMTTVCVFALDLKKNLLIIGIAALGGLSIEAWGTQTELWHYYTKERPPLWIIPAWPTAALTIDILSRILTPRLPSWKPKYYTIAAWVLFPSFYIEMLRFNWLYAGYSMTLFSLAIILLVSVSILAGTCDRRVAVIIFLVGSGLGYFLELWGTTRHCWIYYTGQTPPVFAVFAHGIASVTFWRVHLIVDDILRRWYPAYRGHWSRQLPDARNG